MMSAEQYRMRDACANRLTEYRAGLLKPEYSHKKCASHFLFESDGRC